LIVGLARLALEVGEGGRMADVGGARLRIETEPVKAAADEFRTIADELREELRQLVASVDDVVEGSWRGEAARMFGRDWDEFRAAATNIVDDADEIAIRVVQSVAAYAAQDERGGSIVRSAWDER
jgi:WXG100 family type VII secretion target